MTLCGLYRSRTGKWCCITVAPNPRDRDIWLMSLQARDGGWACSAGPDSGGVTHKSSGWSVTDQLHPIKGAEHLTARVCSMVMKFQNVRTLTCHQSPDCAVHQGTDGRSPTLEIKGQSRH